MVNFQSPNLHSPDPNSWQAIFSTFKNLSVSHLVKALFICPVHVQVVPTQVSLLIFSYFHL